MDFGARCKRVKASKDSHLIWPIDKDLLIKVLCYLPPKILIRCCCVCKGWNELIDRYCVPQITPSLPFLGCHLRVQTSSGNLVVARASIPRVKADVDAWPRVFKTSHRVVKRLGFLNGFCFRPEHLLDSCNGLMLFMHPSGTSYVLWNPNTKQFLLFSSTREHSWVFAVLAVEPTWRVDRKKDFFKIIAFPKNRDYVRILSSRYCMWVHRKVKYNRPIEDGTFSKGQRPFKRCVYLNGRLFILCRPRSLLLWYTIGDDIECDYVKLPGRDDSLTKSGIKQGCIGSCGGRLQFALHDEAVRSVQIWVLSVETREWIFIHRVSLETLIKCSKPVDLRTTFPAAEPKFKLLAFDPISDDGIIIWTPGLVFCYYYKSDKLVPLQCPNKLNDALEDPPCDTYPFTPCLTPLVLRGGGYHVEGGQLVTKEAILPDGSRISWPSILEERSMELISTGLDSMLLL